MMKCDIDGRTLQVFFEYGTTTVRLSTGVYNVDAVSCGVREVPEEGPLQDGQLLSSGQAACSPSDSFNKQVGRKIALDRAIRISEAADFNKAERREIWHNYLRTHRFAEGRGPMTEEELRRFEARIANRRRVENYTGT